MLSYSNNSTSQLYVKQVESNSTCDMKPITRQVIDPKFCNLIKKLCVFLNEYHPIITTKKNFQINKSYPSFSYKMDYVHIDNFSINIDEFLSNSELKNEEIRFTAKIIINIFKFGIEKNDINMFSIHMHKFLNSILKLVDIETKYNDNIIVLKLKHQARIQNSNLKIEKNSSSLIKPKTKTIPEGMTKTYISIVREFNIQFEYFKEHVLPRDLVDESVLPYYNMFVKIKRYDFAKHVTQYDANKFLTSEDGSISIDEYITNNPKFTINNEDDDIIDNNKAISSCKVNHRINYDGRPVSDKSIIIKLNKSFFRPTRNMESTEIQIDMGGVIYGFATKKDLLTCILVAIENAAIFDLKYRSMTSIFKDNIFGGCLINDRYIFWIELKIVHVNSIGIINSHDTRFLHHLTNSHKFNNHQGLESAYKKPYAVNVHQKLDLYPVYHTAVIKRIKQLISDSKLVPEFPFISIECYRPECKTLNIYHRSQQPNFGELGLKCNKCNISEMCINCHLSSHRGDCNAIDEASERYMSEIGKHCPECKLTIVKNEGCNHMHCTVCNTDFCWTCGVKYSLDEINNHYTGSNTFNSCRPHVDDQIDVSDSLY